MTNSERASYIRGLMDGLELDPNAKETKVLNAIVELLDDLCVTVDEIDENMAELSGQVDEIDEDLGDLEEEYYGLDDDECGCGCGHHHDEFDDAEFEVTCPAAATPSSLTTPCWKRAALFAPAAAKRSNLILTMRKSPKKTAKNKVLRKALPSGGPLRARQ